jgi:outer membrane immunogenic protein
MSRIRTLGASAAVLLASAGVAAAADIPPYGQPQSTPSYYNPAPAFSWSGPYAGLIGGFGWANTNPSTATNSGWIAGGFAGANFQTNTNLVLGVEGDFTVSNPWDATLRGRVGFALDKILVYGTGGLAVGRVKAVTTAPSNESATQLGWTVGAGVDAALAQNVIGRLEFRHTNLGTNTFTTPGPITYRSNDVMAGIGFKF